MFYIPMFEIPSREAFLLALLRNIVVEINTTYPEYVALVESLGEEHLVLIADRLQLTGEKPFTWGVFLTIHGQQETFKLWCGQSKKYPELLADERMVMLALEECDGIVADNGRVFIETFEGRSRDIWFDVPLVTLNFLAEYGRIEYSAKQHCYIL